MADPVAAAVREADSLLAAGRLAEAAALFERLARQAPRDARAPFGLARAALAGGDHAAALEHLDRAEALAGRPVPAVPVLRVRILREARRAAEAEAAARAGLAALPDNPTLRAGLAELLQEGGRLAEALATLEGASSDFGSLRVRLRVLQLLDRLEEAAGLLPEACAAAGSPRQLSTLLTLAAQLLGEGPAHEAACRGIAARLAALGPPAPEMAEEAALLSASLRFTLGEADAFRAEARALLAAGRAGTLAPVLRALADGGAGPPGRPRVFGIGLSKTGTSSLTAALERLGWLAQHWTHPLSRQLLRLEDARTFDAMTDISVAALVEPLAAAWPEARFVLTRRPLDSWIESFVAHHRRVLNVEGLDGLRRMVEGPGPWMFGPRWRSIQRELYTGHPDLPTAEAAHTARVRALFRDQPNRLLEFDAVSGDGWPKLCGFLGVPVPEGPFPRENVRPGG